MPYILYVQKQFSRQSHYIIDKANAIIAEYLAKGFSLTLRQIYYQFVARDAFPAEWADPKTGSTNNPASYKKLGNILNDARLAGLVDWHAMEDRTRNLQSPSHWTTPADILEAAAQSYAIDKWLGQQYRPEVWVEKDALTGVVGGVCGELDVAYFSCRGYVSQSEMWAAAMRWQKVVDAGQTPVIIHLGDHDPSGIDMTRDITDRAELFMRGSDANIKRIALNMDQVEEYSPPPNPAKTTDSRYDSYRDAYGDDSWELDALDPQVLVDLIRDTIVGLRDEGMWDDRVALEDKGRKRLQELADKERKPKRKPRKRKK